MASVRYKTFTFNEIVEGKFPEWEDIEEGLGYSDDPDFESGLYELDNYGAPIRLITRDRGEPEDNYLRRDGSYVAGELQKAYEKGLSDGSIR